MSDENDSITLQVFFNESPHTVTVKANDRVDAVCAAVSSLVNIKAEALCMFSESWVGALQHDTPLTYFRIKDGTRLYCFGSNSVAAVTRTGPTSTTEGTEEGRQSESELELKASGIENVGNTCFFGAALQSLFRCTTLRTVLLYMLPAKPLEHCNLFVRALVSAFQVLEQGKTTVNPSELIQRFGLLHPSLVVPGLGGYAMQDAQEAMSQILSDLSIALPISMLCVTNALSHRTQDYLELRNALLSSISTESAECNVIDCLFNTQVEYYLDKVSAEPSSKDSKYFISVNITEGAVSLLDQIDKEMGEEEITLNNEQHIRISRFSFLPPFLFIVINRFHWEEQVQRRLKINKRFSFPFKIDLYKYCTAGLQASLDSIVTEQNSGASPAASGLAEYSLASVIAHNGVSADSGHYITFSRLKGNKWVKFNDESAVEVTEKDIEALSGGSPTFVAYVLLYESTTLEE